MEAHLFCKVTKQTLGEAVHTNVSVYQITSAGRKLVGSVYDYAMPGCYHETKITYSGGTLTSFYDYDIPLRGDNVDVLQDRAGKDVATLHTLTGFGTKGCLYYLDIENCLLQFTLGCDKSGCITWMRIFDSAQVQKNGGLIHPVLAELYKMRDTRDGWEYELFLKRLPSTKVCVIIAALPLLVHWF